MIAAARTYGTVTVTRPGLSCLNYYPAPGTSRKGFVFVPLRSLLLAWPPINLLSENSNHNNFTFIT